MSNKILEQLQGEPHLIATITFKVSEETKEDLVEFCRVNQISMGKLLRKGLELVKTELKKEGVEM